MAKIATLRATDLADASTGTGSASRSGHHWTLGNGTGDGDLGQCTTSPTTWDLDESAIYFRVVKAAAAHSELSLRDASGDGYTLVCRDSGNLQIERRNPGGTDIYNAAWNATTQAWLRVREASGTIFFEGSAGPTTGAPASWSTIASEATNTNGSFDHTAVIVVFDNENTGTDNQSAVYGFINAASAMAIFANQHD